MKKLNKLQKFLLAAFAISIGFFAAVGISLNVMTACAEETTESTENLDDSATDEEVIDGEETSENNFVYDAVGNVYYYVDPDNAFHTIMFTILENEKLKVDMFDGDDLLATMYGSYKMVINKLHVYANNEWMGVFVLYPDGRAIEYVEEEDSGVLDEESDNSAILNEIKDYLDSRTDESGKIDFKMILTDVKFWIIQAISFLAQTGIGAAILGIINRKNKKDNVLTEAQVERIATAAAKKTAENVIGKSIDVDISAEVSKAVEQKMHALANTVGAMQESVKNAEVLMANVAMAQSKSKLLTEEEQKALQTAAMKCVAHAGKKVVSTAKIELAAAEEKDFETIMSEIKEECGNCEAWSGTDCTRNPYTQGCLKDEKNIHYLNFKGVKKQ